MPDVTLTYVVLIRFGTARTMRVAGEMLQWFAEKGQVISNDHGYYETTDEFAAFVSRLRYEERRP